MSGVFGFRIGNRDKMVYPQPFGEPSVLGYNLAKFIAAHTPEDIIKIAEQINLIGIDDPDLPPIQINEKEISPKILAYSPSDVLFSWLSEGLTTLVGLPERADNIQRADYCYIVDVNNARLLIIFLPLKEENSGETVEIPFLLIKNMLKEDMTPVDFESWIYQQISNKEKVEMLNRQITEPKSLDDIIKSAIAEW